MRNIFGVASTSDTSKNNLGKCNIAEDDSFPEPTVDNARALQDVKLEKYVQEAVRREKILATTNADDVRTHKRHTEIKESSHSHDKTSPSRHRHK